MWFRVGLIAIVASFLPWLAIAVAPLFGLSLGAGMGLVGALLVLAEVRRPGIGGSSRPRLDRTRAGR